MTEKQIQIALIKYLNLRKNVMAFSVPNERKSSYQAGALLNKMGRVSGIPDLIIIKSGGKYLHLEIKTEKGRLSLNQKNIISKLQDMSCNTAVGYGLKDCLAIVNEFLKDRTL